MSDPKKRTANTRPTIAGLTVKVEKLSAQLSELRRKLALYELAEHQPATIREPWMDCNDLEELPPDVAEEIRILRSESRFEMHASSLSLHHHLRKFRGERDD